MTGDGVDPEGQADHADSDEPDAPGDSAADPADAPAPEPAFEPEPDQVEPAAAEPVDSAEPDDDFGVKPRWAEPVVVDERPRWRRISRHQVGSIGGAVLLVVCVFGWIGFKAWELDRAISRAEVRRRIPSHRPRLWALQSPSPLMRRACKETPLMRRPPRMTRSGWRPVTYRSWAATCGPHLLLRSRCRASSTARWCR